MAGEGGDDEVRGDDNEITLAGTSSSGRTIVPVAERWCQRQDDGAWKTMPVAGERRQQVGPAKIEGGSA